MTDAAPGHGISKSPDVAVPCDSVVMRRKGRRPRRPIDRIVAGIKPASYRKRRVELGNDPPVGKELW